MSSPNPVTIAFVIHALGVGGAEQKLMDLTKHLKDNPRVRVLVVCMRQLGVIGEELHRCGVEVQLLEKAERPYWMQIRALMRLFRKEKVKLVHTMLYPANVWGRLAAYFSDIPVITAEENQEIWKKWYHHLVDRWMAVWTGKLVACSSDVARFIQEHLHVPKEKVAVILSGVDTHRFRKPLIDSRLRIDLGINEDALVVGTVARLVQQKGHQFLLAAIPDILRVYPKVCFLLVGEGKLRQALEAQARELGIERSVIFAGTRRDTRELLGLMDLFVLPSVWEGLGIVILEAMAVGVPVIASNVGGIPEIVTHGRTGWLVAPGQADALTKAVVDLLQDAPLREQLRDRATHYVDEHRSVAVMTRRHMELYAELVPELRNGKTLS